MTPHPPDAHRPPGLAGEVRTSPRKPKPQLEPPSSVNAVAAKSLSVRNLDFRSKQKGDGVEPTWAERVKGVTRGKLPPQSDTEEVKSEMVTRNGKLTVPPRHHLPAMGHKEGGDRRPSEVEGEVERRLQEQAETKKRPEEQESRNPEVRCRLTFKMLPMG